MSTATASSDPAPNHAETWWKGAAIYHIYLRSFKDSNNDGIGDLNGIREKLDYIKRLNMEAIWISPFFTSPMADFGYDISDFCNVDPTFGTLDDFRLLLNEAHSAGLKIIIDQVYSHSSDQHKWFVESKSSRDNEKADWYVWADPRPDGTPPNNWLSVFGGSAWAWCTRRQQYYLHNFLDRQPDLNLHNRDVQDALLEASRFWLDMGVDGFRLDALNFAMHDQSLRDNPARTQFKWPPRIPHDFQQHIHNMSQPETLEFVKRVRAMTDEYPARFTVAEIGGPEADREMHDYIAGNQHLNTAYSFDFLYAEKLTAGLVAKTLAPWTSGGTGNWPSWAFSNHDAPRALSRWKGNCPDRQYAQLLALLLASLRGNIFVYQGEEIAMLQSVLPLSALKDPEAIASYPNTLGRDGARTPMLWVGGHENRGFSQAEGWLPADCQQPAGTSVSEQDKQADSVLNFYRMVMNTRRNSGVLRLGEMNVETDGDLVTINRAHQGQTARCQINLGNGKIANVMQADGPLPDITVGEFDAQSRSLGPFSGILCLG